MTKAKTVSGSKKAGIQFPVGRIRRHLRELVSGALPVKKPDRTPRASRGSRATRREGTKGGAGAAAAKAKKAKHSGPRLAAGTPVYLAAVIEYLVAEIMELAGNAAKDNHRKRIIPRYILLAVKCDEELSKVFKGQIADGGVVPWVHPAVKGPKKGEKKKKEVSFADNFE